MFKRNKEFNPNRQSNLINPDAKSCSLILFVLALCIVGIIDPNSREIFINVATSVISVQFALNIQNVPKK